MRKKTRLQYSEEFKAEAVRLLEEEGYRLTEAGRRLGADCSCLARWRRERRDGAQGGGEPAREIRNCANCVRKSAGCGWSATFQKSDGLLCQRVELRYQFIEVEKASYPVKVLCRVMQVSRSGFYDWARREPVDSGRQQLIGRIQDIHQRKRGSYGSRRMSLALKREGFEVGRYQARSLMDEAEVECRQRRRYRSTTDSGHGQPVAPNLLAREFDVAEATRVWCADITAIWTLERWLYLAAVLDLHDRQLVGWAMAGHMRSALVLDALEMTLGRRRPQRGLLHHSDQGSQYASHDYRQALELHGLVAR